MSEHQCGCNGSLACAEKQHLEHAVNRAYDEYLTEWRAWDHHENERTAELWLNYELALFDSYSHPAPGIDADRVLEEITKVGATLKAVSQADR